MAGAPGTGKQGILNVIKDHKRSLQLKLNKYLTSKNKAGYLTIYKMNMERVTNQNIKDYGTAKANKENKVIMMVGETGSGITALINTMVNFIFGVDWKDDHRIQLIEESSEKSEAHSQTSSITICQINHEDNFRIPYSITIIDIPGFGDTRGTYYDEIIMRKIREFFHNSKFTKIDAICFVVQSSLSRLTPTQKYIYDNILSIFGNDMKDNIVFFTTFADDQEPNVLSAIMKADLPCAKSKDGKPVYFKVNNSMLYANNCPDEVSDTDYMTYEEQWKMGMKSVEKFLLHFLPEITSKDLSSTKKVLTKRNTLQNILDGLVRKIEKNLFQQQELEETEKTLNEHKKEIEKNADFEIEVIESVNRKIYTGTEYSTNCHECCSTCHRDCFVNSNLLLYACNVFYWYGTCKVCKHGYSQHYSEKFYWIPFAEKKKKTFWDVKKKYEKGQRKPMTLENVLTKIKEDIEKAEDEIQKLILNVVEIHTSLQEIALKPIPMSAVEYIQLLSEKEKLAGSWRVEGKEGYMRRIKILERAIQRYNDNQ